MKAKRTTEDLIRDLAGRPVSPPLSAGAALVRLSFAMLVPLTLFWVAFGIRADLEDAMLRLPVQAKTILPLALALMAASLAITSWHPGKRIVLWPLVLPALAGLALVGLRLAEGSDDLGSDVLGQTALACLTSILAMSALPVWIAIRLFRHGAPTRPRMTGALLGLAVGAGVTSGYALHCTEDSPLFFMVWYGLAIIAVAGFGAILGNRFLRW